MPETQESMQQADRIENAVKKVVALGPDFLHGDMSAQAMTDAMIAAVHSYQAEEEADGRDGAPLGARSFKLMPVLQELITCGGGYQANRCDADCVANTIRQLVDEFPLGA